MAIPLFRRAAPDPDRITITHGGDSFPVRVTRHARARRYSLRLSSKTNEVILTLPPRGSLHAATDFAVSQGAWIAARIRRIATRTPFAHGAIIPLRGIDHRVIHRPAPRGVVTEATDAAGAPTIAVYGDAPHVARRLRDFLTRQAKRDLLLAVEIHARTLGVTPSRISVKDTVSRWGSCSASGNLSFSWRLIMAPSFVLHYLAAHEVAHLKEMNHSTRFWRIVASLDPRWREAERWLSHEGSKLHLYG
ncbi:MAG: metal-dependent hydrolase [Rhizobiales bacterium 65-9]|nr:M48 family metallopeptidase [Hyphomicrobiales bacterium]OJY34614.1 MAG: metal-dependent hydrolase [Rhizobiales bacterium 65-9]